MSNSQLNAEEDFLVNESKIINFIGGGVLLLVFFISLSFGDYGWSNFIIGVCLFLIPGAIAISRGRRKFIIMRINKSGFYYAGQLVTNWSLFYDAVLQDKTEVGSYKDNFVLDIRYYSVDYSLLYTQSIPLTNTQDKAEEEIIEAIQFYYNASKSTVVK